MNETPTFRLDENHKFTIVALRGANIARNALAQDLALDHGVWLLGHPPVTVDDTWQKWLGSLQASKLKESNLVILATAPSVSPFVLDGENQALERHSLNLLVALGLAGLWFDGPGMILNGCQLDAKATEPTQVRQVHDTAVYRRPNHAIPPSLNREDLMRAGTLAAPLSTLLQQKGNRLLKGLSAVHKGLEGRYGDERLHQFVRSLEAVMRPETGRTERQFVHRAQVFIGRTANATTIARQLYRLRSCVEHMNEYTTELQDIACTKAAAETLAQRRSIQAGLLATHAYRHILGTPALFATFTDETSSRAFSGQNRTTKKTSCGTQHPSTWNGSPTRSWTPTASTASTRTHDDREKKPRQRNLWVTDTVQQCREARLAEPANPLPDGWASACFS